MSVSAEGKDDAELELRSNGTNERAVHVSAPTGGVKVLGGPKVLTPITRILARPRRCLTGLLLFVYLISGLTCNGTVH
jgi:hypothetical protein